MRRIVLIFSLIFTLLGSAWPGGRMVFSGGISQQRFIGGIELDSNINLNTGIGFEAVKDFTVYLKFDVPAKYNGSNYPVRVDINGADSSLYFTQFTAYNLMIVGSYILPVFRQSRVNPKIYGSLGLYWLYNSKSLTDYPNVDFSGLGPEFGLGWAYKASRDLSFDFTVSMKLPTYLEYRVQGHPKSAIGVDTQIVTVNVNAYYFLDLP
jgi:hypothetical protein